MSETTPNLTTVGDSGKNAGLVTVILPIYNAACYLRECLDSVSAQTYRNIEVLMVNDGSTDDSAAICRQYERTDSRFRVINRANGGVSVARNTGIAMSSGEFICFIDADDVMHTEAIEAFITALGVSGADMVQCAFDSGNFPRFSDIDLPSLSNLQIYDNYELLEKGLYQSVMVNSACGALFRRYIFDGGLRFSVARRYEDLDIFYKWLLQSRKVAYLPEKLYFYRQHPDSFIQRFAAARLDVLDVTDEMLANISALNDKALELAARDRRFSAHFNIWTLLMANNVELPEIEERCIKVIRQERFSEILNPKVRMKNKLGALASYGGKRLVRALMGFVS
ncbi:MAG: glycosyltransferase family 2 protein [Bacteroidales bacterium]|nr:glycosyltransferase family 2 protein [Bacteroidales bacterium]